MAASGLETPVVLIVYNRPEVTARVLAAIALAKPRHLLVVADGPRSRADEAKCNQVRALLEAVPWECRIDRNYADHNLGVRMRPPTGLDWAFTLVEEAIVLEDDCLPAASFFPFCAQLLHHYRDDERVMQIGGSNFQRGVSRAANGYYFSTYYHVWGWATWRRAWRHYDVDIARWPELKRNGLMASLPIGSAARRHWTRIFDRSWSGGLDTWDYQWQFAMWSQYGVAAVPDVNLISNIGFGADATHTTVPSWHSELPTSELRILGHPTIIAPDRRADDLEYLTRHVHQTPLLDRLASRARRSLRTLASPSDRS